MTRQLRTPARAVAISLALAVGGSTLANAQDEEKPTAPTVGSQGKFLVSGSKQYVRTFEGWAVKGCKSFGIRPESPKRNKKGLGYLRAQYSEGLTVLRFTASKRAKLCGVFAENTQGSLTRRIFFDKGEFRLATTQADPFNIGHVEAYVLPAPKKKRAK